MAEVKLCCGPAAKGRASFQQCTLHSADSKHVAAPRARRQVVSRRLSVSRTGSRAFGVADHAGQLPRKRILLVFI